MDYCRRSQTALAGGACEQHLVGRVHSRYTNHCPGCPGPMDFPTAQGLNEHPQSLFTPQQLNWWFDLDLCPLF